MSTWRTCSRPRRPRVCTPSTTGRWPARDDGGVLPGCGALKDLGTDEGEIKSMRTARPARGRGIAALILGRILDEAGQRGYHRLLLETGSQEFFAPARRLYARHGFVPCPPFAGYQPDPNSVFMARSLLDGLAD